MPEKIGKSVLKVSPGKMDLREWFKQIETGKTRGKRPFYYDGDYYCSVCGEPWDAYSVREALEGKVSDMTKKEAEMFMKGKGCPSCHGWRE